MPDSPVLAGAGGQELSVGERESLLGLARAGKRLRNCVPHSVPLPTPSVRSHDSQAFRCIKSFTSPQASGWASNSAASVTTRRSARDKASSAIERSSFVYTRSFTASSSEARHRLCCLLIVSSRSCSCWLCSADDEWIDSMRCWCTLVAVHCFSIACAHCSSLVLLSSMAVALAARLRSEWLRTAARSVSSACIDARVLDS